MQVLYAQGAPEYVAVVPSRTPSAAVLPALTAAAAAGASPAASPALSPAVTGVSPALALQNGSAAAARGGGGGSSGRGPSPAAPAPIPATSDGVRCRPLCDFQEGGHAVLPHRSSELLAVTAEILGCLSHILLSLGQRQAVGYGEGFARSDSLTLGGAERATAAVKPVLLL